MNCFEKSAFIVLGERKKIMGTDFFWFYDVILAAIFIGMIFLGVKRGFVRMLLSLVSVVAAFIIALLISDGVSAWVYDSWVEQPLEDSISQSVNDALGDNVVAQLQKVDMSKAQVNGKPISQLDLKADDAGKITINLSDVNISKTGIDKIDLSSFGFDSSQDLTKINLGTVQIYESDLKEHGIEKMMLSEVLSDNIQKSDIAGTVADVINKINEVLPMLGLSEDMLSQIDNTLLSDVVLSVIEAGDNPGKAVLDNIVKPIVLIPIKTLIFLLLFVIILIVLSLIIKATSLINKLPVIGAVNELLGGVMGLLHGVIVVFVIVILVHLVVAFTNNTLIFLNDMTINKSFAFSWIYNFSFLDFLQ